MKRNLAYRVCYATVALLALSQGASAAGIATVVDVVNEGYRQPPGAEETTAKSADELVQNEALRTEAELTIAVKFVDGSELSVEQSSEMVLSDYVFDGSAASGLINLNNGLFHFTSNGNNDQGVKLRTPVATIGVRGRSSWCTLTGTRRRSSTSSRVRSMRRRTVQASRSPASAARAS